jgi:hypothetical protein
MSYVAIGACDQGTKNCFTENMEKSVPDAVVTGRKEREGCQGRSQDFKLRGPGLEGSDIYYREINIRWTKYTNF